MSFARSIINDLVERRLWPFALLLVVAIIAIPVVLGGGGDAGSDDASMPIAPANAAGNTSAVELLPPPSVRKRAGKLNDPFRRKAKSDTESAGESNTVVSGTGGKTGGTTGGTTGGATTEPGTTDGTQDKEGSTVDEAGPSAYDLTKVADVRFGKRGGTLKRIRNLAPLSELPSSGDAIVMFAGALKNKSVGRFIIVSNGGETTGDGECKTRGDACVSIDLEAGDRQLFRVDEREYELQLVAINRVSSSGSRTGHAYSTRVTFGSGSERGISRLARLGGSDDNPGVLYLGVYSDRKRALFVLGPNASAKSLGDCMDAACRVIGMRSGASGTVTVAGSTRRLDVKSVRRLTMSASAARRARARVASGGRDVLRTMLEDGPTADALRRFRYSTDSGTISREASRG